MKEVKDEVLVIQGSGGGSGKKQHTPVEEPNTLRSKVRARILDLVAYGPIKGLVNGLQSVYLDGTPVENADGTLNFQGITVTTREGYPDQTYIPGFRSIENTTEVNTEIKQSTPVIRSMTNNDADAAAITIQLAGLYKQEDNGDTVASSVEVHIDFRKDGGAWQRALTYTFQGKTTAPYPKTFRIDLKQYGKGNFDLRVSRPTKESETSKLADKMTWTLMTEIIDRRFSHPNMAMVGIEVDSELFGAQMPARVYHMDLSITQVPSNWDPITRVYTGIWDGTFKDAWHDNPAWAYYDLATHPVIGAGLDVIDKWELYRISQFCDEMVPNGYGGMEPRFTINTVFADQEDATAALNTLASIFRGMTYWGSNTVVPVADMPENPVLTVGPASVKDGDFARTGTSMRERHSVAIVMWNDPDDMGKAVPEIYEDPDSLAEFGWRETRVTAVACNSRGQARRMAMWILDSERYETQTLSYTGTTEHAFLRPGNIIEVADPFEQGARMSGRLLERSTNQVTLDKVPTEAVAQVGGQWWLSVMLPDLTLSRHQVSSFDGDVVHLVDPLLTLPVVGAIWGLYSAGLQLPYYRVVSNAEDSATGMFQVTATEYDPNKYSRVELGLILPERPISLIPNGPLPAPTNLEFKVYTYYAGTARQQGLLISFEPPSDVRIDSFVIDVKSPSDASYRTVYNGPGTSFDMTNAEAGQWTVRVRSTASTGKLSQWTARTVQISQLLLPTPPDSVNVAAATFSITLTPISAYADAMWEFWRSLVPLTSQQIEANAQQLPTGQYLVDADLKPDTQYYYYVRGVNQYGKSNWFGVQGKTLNDFDDILEAVTEDIKDGVLYEYFEEKIDTKAAQTAIDKATEVVNGALTEVNQSIADLNATVDQVGSTVTTGLADANAAIQAVKTQADGIRADVDANVASVTGTLAAIMSDIGTLQSDTGTLKSTMTSVQGSIAAINTTTGTLRTDLTALQTSVSTQVSGLQAQLDAAASAREYNKANAYTAGQFISVGRSLYQAKIAVPAKADGTNAPPNATYWRDAGSVVASADGLASRVSSAETTIGTINGTLTSQATEISGIKTTLNGKADASALTALTSRVTAAENTITSQGSAITSLNNTVAGKADASALTALTTRVTSAEGTLTSLGNSLTSVQAALGNIAGNGSNLVPSEYSWLSAAVPTIAMSPVTPVVSEADATVPSGYRYKITRGNASNPWTMFCKTNNAAGWNTTLTAGTYIVSFYANTNAAGVTNGLKVRSAVWDGASRGTTDFTVTASRTRYSHLVTLAADTVGALTIFLPAGAVGDLLWVDSLMIERQIAGGTVPSAFVAGPTGSEITGLATAQTALEARVTAAEGVNTSQATSITNLNSSLAGKADASALTALTTRVTAAEGVNTSQGDAITSLNNTVAGKADASALTALTTRVTAAEGSISSQGSAITNLTNSLAGKADASALTALTTRVTSAEGTLTSLGNSMTSVQATLGGISGNGTNMLPAEYCVFGSTAPAMVVGGGITAEVETDATAFSGYALKFQKNSGTATVYLSPSTVFGSANMVLKKKKYLVSMYARAGTAGHQFRAGFRAIQADGTVVFHYPSNMTVTTEWARYTTVIDMTASPADKMILCIDAKSGTGAYGVPVWVDKVMVEEQIGTGVEPSAFVIGNSAGQVTGLATAQTALEARVTSAEGVNTSQATSITNLNTSLSGKADAAALTALTSRVTAAEGTISSQGSSITSLTNSLAGKADVSALNALTTRVTAAEGTLTALGSSVTSVQATLGNIAGSGVNLLPSEYSWLTSTTLPTMTSSLSNRSGVAVAGSPSGFGYYLQATSNSLFSYMVMAPSNAVANYNLSLEAGTYLVSMYVKGDTAGQVMANLYDGTNSRSATLAYTAARQRLTFVINLPAAAKSALLIYPNRQGAATAGITVDSIMIESRVGENNTPSTFVPGPSASEVAANAAATTALEARVTAAEGVNTSQATSITNLNTSVAGKADNSALTALTSRVTTAEGSISSQGSAITSLTAGLNALPQENLIYDPDYTDGRNAFPTVSGVTITSVEKTDASAPAGSPSPRLLKFVYVANTGANYYQRVAWPVLLRDGSGRLAVQEGEVYDVSFQVYREGTTDRQFGIWVQPYSDAGTSINHGWLPGTATSITTVNGQWVTISGTITVPVGAVNMNITLRASTHAEALTVWVTRPVVQRRSVQAKNQAAATSALDTRVTAAEGTITSQGSSITNLNNSLASKADASALTALTTRVTAAEGVNTSQGTSITNLTNSLAGKADASALTALTTRVTAAEGAITSQGNSITTLTSMIGQQPDNLILKGTFEDGDIGPWTADPLIANVTAHASYSKAIQFMANSFCGTTRNIITQGGEMFDCSADIWNNYMTAGQTTRLQMQFYDKNLVNLGYFTAFTAYAGTNGFQTYSGRVTAPAGSVTARFVVRHEPADGTGRSLWCNIQARRVSMADSANAAATAALTTRVTAAEGSITSQGTAITNLTNTVSGKADASALTALTTRVTAAEGNISSLSSSVTSLSSTLGGIAGNGSNLVPSQYSWLTSLTAPTMATSSTNREGVAVTGAVSGFGLKFTALSASNGVYAMLAPTNNTAGWNIQLEPGTYIVSFYGSSSNGAQVQVSMYDGAQRYTPTFTMTTTRTRYSGVITVTAATKAAFTMFYNRNAVNATDFTVDSPMIERQIAGGTVPSTFVAGPTASEVTGLATAQQALDTRVTAVEGVNTSQATSITNLNTSVASKADASALNALTTRVTTAEGAISSQSGSITSLTSGLNGVSTDNLVIDPTYAVGNNTNQGTVTVLTRTSPTVTTIGCPAPRVLNWPVPTSTGNTYMGINAVVNSRSPESSLAHNMAVAEGETYDFELYVFSSVSRQYGLWIQFYDTAGASINHTWAAQSGDGIRASSTAGVWTKLTGSATVPAGVIRMAMCLRFSLGDATVAHICAPVCRKRDGQTNGQATAIQDLDTRVTAAEGVNTSQASSITSLTSTVAGKADTSALNSLTTRVTAAEGSISSQGSAVTALQTSLGNIGGTGSNLNPSEYSVFGPNAPTIGALSSGLTVSTVADSATLGGYALKFVSSNTTTTLACYLHASNTVAAVGSFPMAYSNSKYIISFYAKANVAGRTIKAWVRALNSADAVVAPTAPTFTLTTGWVRYSAVLDLSNATTFSGSRMVFALTPNNSGVSGTEIYLDRIMVEQQIGSSTEPSAFTGGTSYTQAQAQASAINSLDTRVTSAEGVNTSQATSISSLTTRMGSAESSITTTANSLASTNGTLSSMWAMKINTAVGGKQYVAGMGVSMVTTGGITQSEILFQADRFALINASSGAITVPFFIENGVTYIQSAMIKQATIVNAIIGADLTSAAYTNWGGPVMSINFNIGQIVTRHPTSANTYSVMNQNGLYVVVNGVLRVRMGVW